MRREKRREDQKAAPLTPTAATAMLQRCAEHGPEWAIATLKHSTAGGYQNLYSPDSGRGDGKAKPHRSEANPGRPPADRPSAGIARAVGVAVMPPQAARKG